MHKTLLHPFLLVDSEGLIHSLLKLLSKIQKFLLHLNLFRSSSRDIKVVHRQCITTRIFLICLGGSLIVFGLYVFVSTQVKTVTVINPSQSDYEHLLQLYPSTLDCPCSQITIAFSVFITMVPTFHQLCSSFIISPMWYNQLAKANLTSTVPLAVFEISLGSRYFQVLAMVCSLADNTVSNAYRLFSANIFISDHAIPQILFTTQTQALIDAFVTATYSEFSRTFSLVRDTAQASQLVTKSRLNFDVYTDPKGEVLMSDRYLSPISSDLLLALRGTCSCMSRGSECGMLTYVTNSSVATTRIYLDRLIIRCLPVESALTSTLACWYNQTCFNAVRNAYVRQGVTNLMENVPLDRAIPSRFAINDRVEKIINMLVLENWTSTISYEHFYNTCAPASCTYTIEQRFDWFFLFITLSGIFGGLNKGLRLILPVLVRLIFIVFRRIRCRRRVESIGAPVDATEVMQQKGEYSLTSLSSQPR